MSTTEPSGIDPFAENELVTEIGLAVLDTAPPSWKEMTYTASSVHSHTESRVLVTGEDGRTTPQRPPATATRAAERLRELMYREGTGTWFTMTMHLIPPGRHKTDFDYDGEPEFENPPGAEDWAADLRALPREPEHVPAWLHDKLRGAEPRD